MPRGLLTWLVLFAAYAATLGLHATPDTRFSTAEAHRLLVTDSIVHDGDLDLTDQYRRRVWRDWPGPAAQRLPPAGTVVDGRRVEPAGIGTPLVLAPAYAIGGPTAVELWCAALLALAFVLGAALARRVVPEPWAGRAALLLGLSPPALVASTTIGPDAAAAAVLTGAALLALKVREEPRMWWAAWCGALLATLPWLSLRAVPLGLVVALALFRWLRRRRRALAGFVALELVLTSAVVYISVNDRLFGGIVPGAARAGDTPLTGADGLLDHLARLPRLLGALVDRDAGLLRWAPVVALAGVGLGLLWRSRRDRLTVISSGQVDIEVTAGLCALIVGAALVVAALLTPSLHGPWLVPGELVMALPVSAALVAWGARFAPRPAAALAVLTLAGSVWLLAGARLGDDAGVAPPQGPLPWGGAERVLPR